MATATTMRISTQPPAQFALPNLSAEAAQKATEILQENHEKNDIIWTQSGFHNHIPHHICTSFALGGTPDVLQRNYEFNQGKQQPKPALDEQLVRELYDPEVFISKMSRKNSYYSAFLKVFEDEIEKKGFEQMLQEYVFKGDKRANIMFKRLFAGYLHPFIHMSFGLEFGQPAIIAEGLGQACIHPRLLDPYFDGIDAYLKEHNPAPKALVDIFDDVRNDPRLRTAAQWVDGHKILDGVLIRGSKEMIKYASSWRVDPSKLEQQTAEMINACAYMCTAQNPPKEINFDFYFMHSINSYVFFPVWLKQSWLSTENKVKLLEYKGRMDACMYASRRAPPFMINEITDYKPKNGGSDWAGIFKKATAFGDDGHCCKFIRALAMGERYCKPYENNPKFYIKGDMWLKLANMVMDTAERTGGKWIWSSGFEEAWAGSKLRSEQ